MPQKCARCKAKASKLPKKVARGGNRLCTVTRNDEHFTNDMNLVGWGELGGKVEGVDCSGVAQVVLKVLQRSLACDNSLDKESKHGEHSLQT